MTDSALRPLTQRRIPPDQCKVVASQSSSLTLTVCRRISRLTRRSRASAQLLSLESKAKGGTEEAGMIVVMAAYGATAYISTTYYDTSSATTFQYDACHSIRVSNFAITSLDAPAE